MMSKRRSLASSSGSYSSSNTEDSAENDLSSTTSPTPESVRATLDMYVSAARDGRDAFAKGDLQTAARQFDQALALELQTELDCIYDPSIGMVSGLVRQEVSERMMQTSSSPRHSPGSVNCNKIMHSLMQIYKDSEATVRLRPADPKLYLRMGAALCCANEWEKAKKIYTDGLNVCKDRKELKLALRRLTKMEQITAGKEIPAEPYDASNLSDKKNKSRTLPSLSAALRTKRKSDTIEAMDLSSSMADNTGTMDNRRARSKSPGFESPRHAGKPVRARSFGKISRQKKNPEIDHTERESWSMVFQAEFCKDKVQMRPSAISQMRRLSVDLLDQDTEGSERGLRPLREQQMKEKTSFTVKNFQSMKIESDDSELEDDY